MAENLYPRIAVFDIGNVLLGWEPYQFYAARIGEARAQALFREVPLEDMNLEIDRGASFGPTIAAMALMHPDWADEIRDWERHWADMLGPVLDQGVMLLERVRAAGTPLYALSNFGFETWEIARAAHPFLSLFDRAFISGQERLIKPDPAFYALLERETGASGGEIFFVDDRAENIAAAQARGWHCHHLTPESGHEMLEAELMRLSLIR